MSLGKILTSIHGRRLGLTSSGGLAFARTTSSLTSMAAEITTAGVFSSTISNFGSTVAEMTVQGLKSVVETISSSDATLTNYGMSVLSSATATSRNFSIGAPETGIRKVIHSVSSATTLVIDTTADTIGFNSSANTSSTRLTFQAAAGVGGRSVVLEGASASRWNVLTQSADVT